MLTIKRKAGERIWLGTPEGDVWVPVLEIGRGYVRLGFDAPPSVKILREELRGRFVGPAGQPEAPPGKTPG